MNRLIIIGNGFDLAHGLKTSYKDFIKWLLIKDLNALRNGTSNPLFSCSDVGKLYFLRISEENVLQTFNSVLWDFDSYQIVLDCEVLSSCLNRLEDLGWVDVENEYFRNLRSLTKNFSISSRSEILKVNERFAYMKEQLNEYLSGQQLPAGYSEDSKLLQLMVEDFDHRDFLGISPTRAAPYQVYLLDFNYTKTADSYKNFFSLNPTPTSQYVTINNIHGQLNSSINPIVFGFGDEHDKDYLEFENLNENELFRHIKSFSYLKTTNYSDLVRFLQHDSYQVYTLGHSCGISDRTLFRKIMDSSRCTSVKIFYHQRLDGTNDFDQKTFDISRHFRDKEKMRDKIAPFPNSRPMPQPGI